MQPTPPPSHWVPAEAWLRPRSRPAPAPQERGAPLPWCPRSQFHASCHTRNDRVLIQSPLEWEQTRSMPTGGGHAV